MKQIVFLIKGSAAAPYEVTFIKDGENLSALCTCPAGQFGNSCKHRTSILEGKGSVVFDNDPTDALTVRSWLKGTDIESALAAVREAEAAAEPSKERLVAAKKALAKAMHS